MFEDIKWGTSEEGMGFSIQTKGEIIMQQSKKNFRSNIGKCESCGYNKHLQALSLHHLYPKRKGHQDKQAHGLSRRERYLCVCLNCHHLIEIGIIDDWKLLKKILKTLSD